MNNRINYAGFIELLNEVHDREEPNLLDNMPPRQDTVPSISLESPATKTITQER